MPLFHQLLGSYAAVHSVDDFEYFGVVSFEDVQLGADEPFVFEGLFKLSHDSLADLPDVTAGPALFDGDYTVLPERVELDDLSHLGPSGQLALVVDLHPFVQNGWLSHAVFSMRILTCGNFGCVSAHDFAKDDLFFFLILIIFFLIPQPLKKV